MTYLYREVWPSYELRTWDAYRLMRWCADFADLAALFLDRADSMVGHSDRYARAKATIASAMRWWHWWLNCGT